MEEPGLSTEDKAKAEHSRHVKKISEKEQAKRTAELKEKLEERKAQRRVEEQLRGTKALGAAVSERDDDLLAWMSNHKAMKADDPAAQGHDQDKRGQNNEEEGQAAPNVSMKASAVDLTEGETRILTLADASILDNDGHIAEEGDVLEDAGRSRAELMAKKKKAAQSQGLHFEEDSKRLGLLSKYDEEETEALFAVSKDGTLEDEEVRASIAARLRASAPLTRGSAAAAAAGNGGAADVGPPDAAREYMDPAEATAGGFKEKRGKKRKAGKSRKVRFEEDEEPRAARGTPTAEKGEEVLGASVFDELEASGAACADSDRGSRASKRQREAAAAAAAKAEEDEKASRYELALAKANKKALVAAHKASVATGHISDNEEDEEEKKLKASLAKAARFREAAQEGKALESAALDEVAAEVAAAASGKKLPDDKEDEKAGTWHTTDTMAFIDSLSTLEATAAEEQAMHDAADAANQDDDAAELQPMDEDEPVAPKPQPRKGSRRQGGWQEDPDAGAALAAAEKLRNEAAEKVDQNPDEKDTDQKDRKADEVSNSRKRRMRGRRGRDDDTEKHDVFKDSSGTKSNGGGVDMKDLEGSGAAVKEEAEEKGNVLFELQKGLGRGLAEALVIVRERGWLNEVEYRGRISDFKHNQRDLVEDALLSDGTALAHRVGASLQRKDEFGRILTPKEVFRDVSYAFHGYKRAASKKEKNLKSLQSSRAQAGLLDDTNVPYHMSVNPSQLLDDWKARKWRPKWVNYGKEAKPSKKSAGRKGGLTDSGREGVSAALDGSAKTVEKGGEEGGQVEEEAHGWAAEVLETSSVAELPARNVASGALLAGGDRGTEASQKKGGNDKVLPPPPPPME